MATQIFLAVQQEEGIGSKTIWVGEDFDTTIEKIFPVQQPSSALEARSQQLFHDLEGRRMMIHPGNVFLIIEDSNPEA